MCVSTEYCIEVRQGGGEWTELPFIRNTDHETASRRLNFLREGYPKNSYRLVQLQTWIEKRILDQ